MGVMKNLLLHRNGRDQYGIADDERHFQREYERRQALTQEERDAEDRESEQKRETARAETEKNEIMLVWKKNKKK